MTRKAFALGLLILLTFSLMSLPSAQAKDPVLINAAGATFPYPIYSKWFDDFHKANPGVQINYASVGSGAGIGQLQAGTVDFGASDVPMTDDQLAQAKVKVLHFPSVLGAAVVRSTSSLRMASGIGSALNFLVVRRWRIATGTESG